MFQKIDRMNKRIPYTMAPRTLTPEIQKLRAKESYSKLNYL
jgi:hypothetical protein